MFVRGKFGHMRRKGDGRLAREDVNDPRGMNGPKRRWIERVKDLVEQKFLSYRAIAIEL